MLTIKEIREAQRKDFADFNHTQLIEAYGVINVIKKEFSGVESAIKKAIVDRNTTSAAYAKSSQLTLTFPTGDVEYSASSVTDVTYSLDISEEEFVKLLDKHNVKSAPFVSLKISEKSLRTLKNNINMPLEITAHILSVSTSTVDIKAKKKGGV